MPLYIGDYLRDTSRLTTEQHGAYLLLIMDYWVNGPLPDDDAALASIVKMTPAGWRKARPSLTGYFEVADGRWVHGRIDREIGRASAVTEQRRAAGRASAQRRWSNDKATDEVTDVMTDAVTGEITDAQGLLAKTVTRPVTNGERKNTPLQPQKDSLHGSKNQTYPVVTPSSAPASHPGMQADDASGTSPNPRAIGGGK